MFIHTHFYQQAYFATTVGLSEASELILNCVHYAQVMRLGNRNTADKLCMTMGERQQIRKGVWFLYSLEKIFCMREETFPVRLHRYFRNLH